MATATAKRKRANPTRKPPTQAQEDRIEDVSVGSLVFQSVRKGLSTGVGDVIEDGTLEETMQGASGLKLELLDRDYEALGSGLFNTRVVTVLDGCAFRLTEVSVIDDWKLAVQFEHRLISEMREHTGPLKATRGKVTRAEFILSMLRELKLPFRFICPELHRTQKAPPPERVRETKTVGGTGTSTAKTATAHLADVGKQPGFSTHGGYTVKGHPASSEQLGLLAKALEAAQGTGASKLSMEALVIALIFENDVSNPDPGTPLDRGCLSIIDQTAHLIKKPDGHGTLNPYDIAEVCARFCTGGFAGAGGSNAMARANPRDSPTHIAYRVQAPAKEYPHTSESEARKIVEAFLGSGLSGGGFSGEGASQAQTITTIRTGTYEFTRGKPGQIEDTFTAALRLAEEVGWRFFVSGKRDIYFVNDDDLLKAAPRYVIEADSPGFVKLTFDVEVGARTIIERGKRLPKPSEATLIVRADRWAAPPGCVVELHGWGPADGRWLVDTAERRLHDAEMTMHLRAPQHPLEEPKATVTPSESRGGAADTSASIEGGGASAKVESKIAREHPELHVGIRRACAIILTQFPHLTIGTTTNHNRITGTGGVSLHVSGEAADIVGPGQDEAGAWIAKNMTSMLTEGIHNPTLSVKNGQHVSAGYWESEWANHTTHIHVGVKGG